MSALCSYHRLTRGALLALLCALCATLSPKRSLAQEGAPPILRSVTGAIRNGFRVPRTLFIPTEQMYAIGWLKSQALDRFCTATIISPTAVITARHCFEDPRVLNSAPLSFNVSRSDNGINADEQVEFSIDQVTVNNTLDIAIIVFPNAPFLAWEDIEPMPINRSPIEGDFYNNLIGQQISAAGYGNTFDDIQDGRYFASVRVELITSRSFVVNGERRQGICKGDSGGPIIAPGVDGLPTILAVVSKGDPCCAGIDQITRLDPAIEWIDERARPNYRDHSWPAACAGLSKIGTCSDNQLRRCENGQLVESDCGQQVCDYDGISQAVRCITPCAGIPARGVCSGEQELTRCVRGQPEVVRCDSMSLCSFIEMGDVHACVNPGPTFDGETIPLCIPNEDSIITEASEARFIATSSCQQGATPSPLLGLLLALCCYLSFLRLKASIGSSLV